MTLSSLVRNPPTGGPKRTLQIAAKHLPIFLFPWPLQGAHMPGCCAAPTVSQASGSRQRGRQSPRRRGTNSHLSVLTRWRLALVDRRAGSFTCRPRLTPTNWRQLWNGDAHQPRRRLQIVSYRLLDQRSLTHDRSHLRPQGDSLILYFSSSLLHGQVGDEDPPQS